MTAPLTVAAKIEAARVRRGLSKSGLGRIVGYSPALICKLEAGLPVRTTTLERVALELGLRVDLVEVGS